MSFINDLNTLDISIGMSHFDWAEVFNISIDGYRKLCSGSIKPSDWQESRASVIILVIKEVGLTTQLPRKYVDKVLTGHAISIENQLKQRYLNVTMLRNSLIHAKREMDIEQQWLTNLNSKLE